MTEIIQVVLLGLLAATKILIAPLSMLAAGFPIWKTILVTYVGALIGATVFYYFGVAIFKWWDALFGHHSEPRKLFSRKARAMVQVKARTGIIGLAFLAPIISIPVSAFIIAKFFPGKHKVIAIFAVVLIPISILLTLLSNPVIGLFKHVFHLT